MKTTATKRQVSALRVGTVWLILLILLLLLIDGDEDDTVSVLLTFAAFLLL